ncbi:hypothetical protein H8E77_10515, partial [bacterium]|nr:hypothetical protein [bacterium]
EYGPIDCWWWEAGHLDKERMRWQLEDMKEKGVAGTWYYPRFVYGQPLSSDPHYWTEEWWDFTKFSIEEHRRLGMQVWFNDWTAHQFFPNRVREEREKNPALTGRRLVIYEAESKAPGIIKMDIPPDEEILYAAAYKKVDGGLDYTSRIDLNVAEVARLREFGKLTWEAKEAGWLVTAVTSQPHDLDYLNRVVADRWIEIFLGVYEERLPDFVGNTLKAYGTDELDVLNGNILHSASFISRFKTEKGYDPSPYLVGLFHDIGKFTDKIRCDYYDVMVSMLEENLYQPFSEWLNKRGMIFTEFCPRGKNEDMLVQTYQYGDFFRYMRNYNIPGAEDQRMSTPRTFFAKTASSIAHLYGHNRVGVCAYWGAGWGHNTQQNLAWTNENYVYGVNLYNRHGVLYSTLGGWYEWVPPAVHFRQPYWKYWKHFSDYVKRLSYIMSQGIHVADVALLYPLTTLHANWSGRRDFNDIAQETGTTTYDLAHLIYKSGIDLDFIDSQSLCSAEVSDGKLKVAGLEFRAVVLPPMTTIRTETLKKIKEFYDSGGTVVAFRRLPNASPENGRDDPNIQAMLQEIFGVASGSRTLASSATTKAFFLPDDESPIPEIISNAIVQDVVASEKDIFHTHQKIGEVDVYFLFNAQNEKRSISFVFRASGEPEIWNAFTGETKPVHRFEAQGSRTKVRLDMEPYEGILLVFQKEKIRPEVLEDNLTTLTSVEPRNDGILIQGYCDVGGKKRIRVAHEGKEYISEVQVDEPPEPICLDGLWDFRLEPTMDNRWGDFRYPPSEEFIGAEARRFRYMEEGGKSGAELGWHEREFDDSNWQNVTYSYGPYWWTIGPFEDEKGPEEILQKAKAGEIETDKRYEVAGKSLQWEKYSFSQKFGSEAADVHNEWGGLLGVSENFIVFDATGDDKNATRYLFTHVYSPEEKDYHLNFGGKAKFQRKAWINGEQVISVSETEAEAQEKVNLKRGWNSVLLEMVHPEGEKIWTFAVFQETSETPSFDPYIPLLRWFRYASHSTQGFIEPQKLIFDITPEKESRVGWYRFSAPPGLKSMRLNRNSVRSSAIHCASAWIDGQPVKIEEGRITLDSPTEGVSQIALRVEQEPGCYAGAAFPLPVAFECEEGKIPLGDWCDYGLETYSGGAVYTKVVKLEKSHLEGKVLLDLGQVSTTAEVHVNGKPSGVKMARPFRFDITPLVKEGENQIQVKVVNTLANHMSTYPTNYVYEGQTVSGLLGPVKLQFLSKVSLTFT